MAAIAIAAAAALIAASLMNLPRCIQVMRIDEHAAMWRSGKDPMHGAVMPRILEGSDGRGQVPYYPDDISTSIMACGKIVQDIDRCHQIPSNRA